MSMHKISLRHAHSGLGELCTYPIHRPGSDLYDMHSISRTKTASHSCIWEYTWYCAMLSISLMRETYHMPTVQTTVWGSGQSLEMLFVTRIAICLQYIQINHRWNNNWLMNLVDSRQCQRDHSTNPVDWHLANGYLLIKDLMTRQSPLHYAIVRENVSPRIRRRFDYTPYNSTLLHLVTSNKDLFPEYIFLVYHTVTSFFSPVRLNLLFRLWIAECNIFHHYLFNSL